MAVVTVPYQRNAEASRVARADKTRPPARVADAGVSEPVRLSIRRIGIASMVRVSAVLSIVVASGLVTAGIAVWWVARRAGVVEDLEQKVATGLGLEAWTVPSSTLLLVWAGFALACAVLTVVVAVLLTMAFNGLGRSFGGLDVVARPTRPTSTT